MELNMFKELSKGKSFQCCSSTLNLTMGQTSQEKIYIQGNQLAQSIHYEDTWILIDLFLREL